MSRLELYEKETEQTSVQSNALFVFLTQEEWDSVGLGRFISCVDIFLKKRLKRGKILFIQVNVIFGLYIYSNSKNYIYMYWHIYPTFQKFSRFVSVAL